MAFPFEKLNVYQHSLDLVESIDSVIESIAKNTTYGLRDQLSRAVLSIPLNIAEGNGRWSPRERSRFAQIARASAFECIPILQVARRKGLIDEATYERLYSDIEAVCRMLTAWMRSLGGTSQVG